MNGNGSAGGPGEAAVAAIHDVPAYPEVPTYLNILGSLHIWEGDGWKQESMSWKTGSYLASNLSGFPEVTFSGPHAQEFLSRLSINNVYKWPVGTSKHLVMLDEHGYIASHGLAVRDSEDSFRHFAAMPWPMYKAPSLGLDVEIGLRDIFLFQVAGPTSLQVLERLIGEPLRDLKFLGIRQVSIPGIDASAEIELSRIGMAGTLAYELRGPLEHGPAVFDAVFQAGKEFGLKRLGWRTYVVNHTEGGFPQQGCTFLPAAFADPGFVTHPVFGAGLPPSQVGGQLPGSVQPGDMSARLRTPFEVNWGWMAKFDHDFIGREALEAEAANRRRKTVVLRWNKEDVLDVFASQFEPGEEYKHFEFPTTPQSPAGGHADLVTKDGKQVGVSSVAVYSYYYREMLSHSTIDMDQAEIGTEVIVHWGDHGGRIKPIRATVERFPYLDLASNKDFDFTAVPSGVAAA
ncbi:MULTISPECIES: aminomethyl transferase family protein [unclassified Streptomyces]|uniref:aminomethyl transferase family protein n=1 Tax=unclassified Streptomyces TaxID=2593676 RepID=UPI002253FD1D|nr:MULTISPECIES: aminomethyl transferase family protein [unclassified Streptomyces]MCX4642026.1 aminomethyl transferase family protein [Streptomyces sp. NBC_01446]MCX5085758.1 aminomethyl transferase family protein [Streptomyces sp. NBC_00401]MCX5326899.1 aminomethyl transferase family protein [Streptomyces sp. NBC_00120]